MSKIIFKDPALQRSFETEGYVQIPLLEPEDIAELKAMYSSYFPTPPEGFFSSSYLNDFALKQEISDKVAAIIGRRLPRHFVDYRLFGSAFLSKTAGHRSEMPMHQDWTIVDESRYVAVNVWTPLQDVDAVNGALEVLPGSHSFAPVRRSPTIPFFWEGYQSEMRESLHALTVRAGEAIVLNQALVHASPPNTTDQNRLAITTGVLSGDAPMEFYYQTTPGELEVFRMPDDFLLRWENFHESIFQRPPFGESTGTVAYAHPEFSREKVLEFLAGVRPEPVTSPVAPRKRGFWARLFSGN